VWGEATGFVSGMNAAVRSKMLLAGLVYDGLCEDMVAIQIEDN
jgi:hypothetical protein